MKVESVPSITAASIGGVSRIIQSSQAAPLTTVTILQQGPLGQHQLPVKAITQNGTHLVPIGTAASTGETADARCNVSSQSLKTPHDSWWKLYPLDHPLNSPANSK